MCAYLAITRTAPTIRSITGAGAVACLLVTGGLTTASAASAASPPPRSVPAPYGVARNGSFAFAEDGDIWMADVEGANATAIVTGPARDSEPSFSRDGSHIAFRRDEAGRYPTLMVAEADGNGILELADSTDAFAWSPTGDRLLANHDVDGRPSLSIVQADGSGIRTLEPEGIAPTGWAAWRPASDELIFTGHPRTGASDLGLYAIHPDGTGLRTVGPVSTTESDAQISFQGPRLSPDGSLIAYSNWEPSEAGVLDGYVHVRDLDTGTDRRFAVRPVAEANIAPRFSPDGTTILVEAQSETEELAQLVVATLDGSRPGVVIGPDYSYMQESEFDFSPDGASVVLTLDGVTSIIDVTSGYVVRTLNAITSFPSWQRLAPTGADVGSAALPPDGTWQVELSAADLSEAGWPPDITPPGTYSWTFAGDQARISLSDGDGVLVIVCDGVMAAVGDRFRVSYDDTGSCGGSVDEMRWQLARDGLHLALVGTSVGDARQAHAYTETKPWQAVDTRPIPTRAPWQSRCEPGCQGPVAKGTFTSAEFLPGLQMTFADEGWFNTADYPDEIEFDRGDSAFRFWQTPSASSEQGDLLQEVPRTPQGLTDWFVANPDMVVSQPEAVTLGDGIATTTFTLWISDTNVDVDPGCPSGVRSCLNVLWINEGHVFAIGYGEAVRLYLFTVGTGSDARTIVVSLDAPNEAQLATMTTDVAPILEGLRLPG